jgi:hypothetical protein
VSEINSLADLKPGDIMFGPIGGLVGLGVGLGQLALGEAFRMGRLSVRHVGIVVEASREHSGPTVQNRKTGAVRPAGLNGERGVVYTTEDEILYPTGLITHPRLVQAMPGGAEEIGLMVDTHWTDRHAYVRLPEDWPGQAEDAAAIARLMVAEGVAYSPASYAALALWHWGVKTPRLEQWIGRRREPVPFTFPRPSDMQQATIRLPVEAICSVLVDQCWSLAGKRVVENTKPQVVTPGMMASQLWRRPGVVWGGVGLL